MKNWKNGFCACTRCLSPKGKRIYSLFVKVLEQHYGEQNVQEIYDNAVKWGDCWEELFQRIVDANNNDERWEQIVWTLYIVFLYEDNARNFLINEWCGYNDEKGINEERELYTMLLDKLTIV